MLQENQTSKILFPKYAFSTHRQLSSMAAKINTCILILVDPTGYFIHKMAIS